MDMQVHVSSYPQLRTLCWHLGDDPVVSGKDALDLYEINWRMVEPEKLNDEEHALIEVLVGRFGNGCFLPT